MKEIKLTQGKVALVDDADFEELSKYKWYAERSSNTFYAMRNVRKNFHYVSVRMHKQIMKPPKNKQADHRDHNGLNNQRENLRICTQQQNNMNQRKRVGLSSIYKGVHLYRFGKKWVARIRLNKRTINLGHFKWEADAAKAYDVKAKELFGEFAYLNFT